jgi:hypothetical protein
MLVNFLGAQYIQEYEVKWFTGEGSVSNGHVRD